MYTRNAIIQSANGLHARPASLFVSCASQFQADVTIQKTGENHKTANAKSIIMVLGMGIYHGDSIEIIASGEDEVEAVDALVKLVEDTIA